MKYLNEYKEMNWDFDDEEKQLIYKFVVNNSKECDAQANRVYILFDDDKLFVNHQMPRWAKRHRSIRELSNSELELLKNDKLLIKIREDKISYDDNGWNMYYYSELIEKYPELKI